VIFSFVFPFVSHTVSTVTLGVATWGREASHTFNHPEHHPDFNILCYQGKRGQPDPFPTSDAFPSHVRFIGCRHIDGSMWFAIQ
jgi:hypothetical protein